MYLWLDFILFGNGRGLKSPYCDDKFYWLRGNLYHWIGGFGAQLGSFEWFSPKAGTTRRLAGQEFTVFSVQRKFLRVRVSWALARGVRNAEELYTLKSALDTVG